MLGKALFGVFRRVRTAEEEGQARHWFGVKFIDFLRQRFAISGGKRHELPGGREGVILWEVEKRKWTWTNRGGSAEVT